MIKPIFSVLTTFLLSAALVSTGAKADEPLIPNGRFTSGMDGWSVTRLEKTVAESKLEAGENGQQAIHLKIPQAGAKRYFVQLVHKDLQFHAGKTYHLHFRARCKPAGEIAVIAASNHDKYEELWRQEHIAITEQWADYTCDIKPKDSDDGAVLIFNGLAAQAGEFWFADVSMTVSD